MIRTFTVAALLSLLSLEAAAQAPSKISWQGFLTDGAGQPVTTPQDFTVGLYDAPSGGSLVWDRSYSNVPVLDGVFSLVLEHGEAEGANADSLGAVAFDGPLWVQVSVGGVALGGRSPLTSVPFALSLRNLRVFPSETRPDEINVVGGSHANGVGPLVGGATISGGGKANGGLLSIDCVDSGSEGPNFVGGNYGTVGGGVGNQACGFSTVGGGNGNKAAGEHATVGGGLENIAGSKEWSSSGATVGGGVANTALGNYATVPGGRNNQAQGDFSFAAGFRARADHEGTFVWADRGASPFGDDFVSTAADQFLVRAAGGVGIGTATLDPSNRLTLYGGDLSLQTNNNTLDQSILFQNSGQFYTWRIYRKDAGSNAASLRIAGGASADKTLLSDRMVFAADGHIGIGTDAPVGLLNVSGTDIVRFDRSDNGNALLGLLASTGREWRLISTGSSDNHGSGLFQIRDATQNIDRLTITTTGEVGIGTAAPANRLSVDGSADISGALGVGTSAPETPLAVNAGLGGNDVGITQGQLGGSHAMELTTSDADGDQATRLLLYGASNGPDIAFYRGGRGAEALSMSIKGASGRVGIGTNIPAKLLDVNGDLVAVSVTETSDARLKTGIEPISHPLETVRDLQGVAYHWNRDRYPERNLGESRRIGFLAQDVARVLPEVVDEGADGLLSVNYGHVVALLVEALKERDRKTEALEKRVADLERMILAPAGTR